VTSPEPLTAGVRHRVPGVPGWARVAHREYDVEVPLPRLGPEFDGLTRGFNQLAGSRRSN
jgi:hypothetical protein